MDVDCDTCGGTGTVPWMIEGDPNCYQERDSEDQIACPDCSRAKPRVRVSRHTQEALEAARASILEAHPGLLRHAADGELVGEEHVAFAEYGEISWLLGD